MKLRGTQKWYWMACAYEFGILLGGVVLNFTLRTGTNELLIFSTQAITGGVLATIPILAFFVFTISKPIRPFTSIRRFLDGFVRPLFAEWSIPQLLLISVLAGLGEEYLFRGVIQHGLSAYLGTPAAIICTSILFGLCHFISPTYAIAATAIGVYFGIEFIMCKSLIAPILSHALYDFAMLLYFLRFTKPAIYETSSGKSFLTSTGTPSENPPIP